MKYSWKSATAASASAKTRCCSDISLSVERGTGRCPIIGPSGSRQIHAAAACATLLETMDGGDLKYMGQNGGDAT